MKTYFSLALIFLFTLKGFAQEKIYLKTQKEPISCQILEINTEEVKYRPEGSDVLTIGISKNDVSKIVFKNGDVQYFLDPLESFQRYVGQKRWNAKIGLLSPVSGYTDLYLEKALKPGRSVELQMNIIGLGTKVLLNTDWNTNKEYYFNQRGLTIGGGLKVLKLPDFELSNRKLTHILQGSYLKPSILIGYYQRDFVFVDPNTYKYNISRKGIMTSMIAINVGKQWVLDNTFSIDMFASFGLGFDNFRKQETKVKDEYMQNIPYYSQIEDNLPYRNFGYTRFGKNDLGVSISGGIKIGYLFNMKKKESEMGFDKMRARLNK